MALDEQVVVIYKKQGGETGLQAEDCIRALPSTPKALGVMGIHAVLVLCFSAHPLISGMREMFIVPVVGIMEAALYITQDAGRQVRQS